MGEYRQKFILAAIRLDQLRVGCLEGTLRLHTLHRGGNLVGHRVHDLNLVCCETRPRLRAE